MSIFNTTEPTVTVRMTGYMSYGPTSDGSPSHVLENGGVYDVPQGEAAWLVSAELAELI
ncbi:hypothetical protein [Streptomyces sp. WAC06614]|uniref:hypothetical protein n=1 Tax=Streptomyces sp. WAC06614 TaxID=2487416 RepID=UPI00163C8B1C|nr:hypothetical protein [Streptomyces sp. WAC06614]